MFDNTMKTTTSGLTDEMKTFYDKQLIKNAKANLVHSQFAQKKGIPKNGGKTIEFRKYAPLPKALTPLTEGVTPSGRSLSMSVLTATLNQYGDYVEISDQLDMFAIDNNLIEASKLLGVQSGETLDTVTREVLNGGTNVQYADEQVAARYLLVGGDATPANNHYITVDVIKKAVRTMKNNKAMKIEGDFVQIVHPDTVYDIQKDSAWVEASKYAGSKQIFDGEIGKIHGVRFVETTESKIFHAENLTAAARNVTMASLATKTFTVDEAITAGEATALVGRKLIIKGYQYTVASAAAGAAGAATITVSETVSGSPTDGEIIYPGEAGAKGRDVYSSIMLGADAYGDVDIEGGGIKNIIKQLGSAGTADPLNQRATSGWKAFKTAVRLVETYMLRIETASTSERGAN